MNLRFVLALVLFPLAVVLFGILTFVGLVFALPILLVVLAASVLAGVVTAIVGFFAFVHYATREEPERDDPGDYSLDQTK